MKINRDSILRNLGLSTALFLCFASAQAQNQRPYFQQEVNYVIEVQLNDELHELSAFEAITYHNRSRSTLDTLYFHLWPNAYKNGETALGKQLYRNGNLVFENSEEGDFGYIDSLDFFVDDKRVKWEYDSVHSDICVLYLNQPLAPMESIRITTPFRVKLPVGKFSRLGHDDQAYQITQWYPKPAVYDRDGWHAMPYLDQGEFYSEFGSFDVRITLPANYVVGATGDLQNPEEREWMLEKARKTAERTTYSEDLSFPPSSDSLKTLRYLQKNIHDFGWFADKRYHVLRGSVQLPDSPDSVETWVMYTNLEADLWKKSIPYVNQSIYYYSLWNGNYPYRQMTALQGALNAGGGMEYPNVTVIGETGDDLLLDNVIAHETGHNWFYGMLGFNERRYPFLDEGINSFYELRYMEQRYPKHNMAELFIKSPFLQRWFNLENFDHREFNYFSYLQAARANSDQELTLPSADYTSSNYGAMVYMKTSLGIETLRAHLGDSIFDLGMQTFFERWKFKHPGPSDWQQVMEEVSGQNLSWFFGRFLNTTLKSDLKVKKIKKTNDEVSITVKNKKKLATPVLISARSNNQTLNTYSLGLIDEGEKETFTFKPEGATEYRIDGERSTLDLNRRNNTIRNQGMFKKMEPLQLRFLTSTENPNKTQLFWTPLVGWNTSDQTMLGLAIYNKSVTEKPFEFYLGPMYSFKRDELTGIVDLSYHLYFQKLVQRLTVNFNWMRFSYDNPVYRNPTEFNRYYPKVIVDFKPRRANSYIRQRLSIGALVVEEETISDGQPILTEDRSYATLAYHIQRNTALHYMSFTGRTLASEDLSMLSGTIRYFHRYNQGRNRVSLRLFGGTSLNNTTNNGRYNWRMDGQSGWHDFTFNQVFPDRAQTHSVWSQQMNDNMGAFKTPTAVGQSKYWLLAANFKVEAPLKVVPIGAYMDLGTSGSESFMASGGLYFRVIRGACEVYFPLFWSQNILDAYEANDIGYGERIRFTLNLPAVNPYKLVQEVQ